MTNSQTSQEWRDAAANTRLPPVDVMAAFGREIARQEDIAYGVALFFEGLSLLLAGNEAVVETHRRQFRNIIRSCKQVNDWARTLVEQASRDSRKARQLRSFNFLPCNEHPDPDDLIDRALLLVDVYNELFPGRSREQEFAKEEILKLMETSARRGLPGMH